MTRTPWRPRRCSCCNNYRRRRAPQPQWPRTPGRRTRCRTCNISCCCNSTLALGRQHPRTRRHPLYLVRRRSTPRICKAWQPSRPWVTPPVSMVSVDLVVLRTFISAPLHGRDCDSNRSVRDAFIYFLRVRSSCDQLRSGLSYEHSILACEFKTDLLLRYWFWFASLNVWVTIRAAIRIQGRVIILQSTAEHDVFTSIWNEIWFVSSLKLLVRAFISMSE